eukprot:CAMPEP_0177669966 /NCGR_PEP_ID=MMETSP0447-20121125/23804_1 /TAXON_ID=0 /ORGANISM="Stygamoeba regulata, Strain BSH-02190019" /LENGTH=430 /DNA_ID=CAMNT_0019177031 /DNA_START=112 /DNA_END=1404 /DNA_ORIENTATION=+
MAQPPSPAYTQAPLMQAVTQSQAAAAPQGQQQGQQGWGAWLSNLSTFAVVAGNAVLSPTNIDPTLATCRALPQTDPLLQVALLPAQLCTAIGARGLANLKNAVGQLDCELNWAVLQEESTIKNISWLICTNHSKKIVFVVFRGSRSTHDWMINFTAVSTPFQGGVNVHRGIYLSLLQTYRVAIEPQLSKFFEKNPSYVLNITGHSLGGGYATVLYLILQKECKIRVPTKLFTFAAPTVIHASDRVSAASSLGTFVQISDMHHFVFDCDIVPRLLGGKYHAETMALFSKVMGYRLNGSVEDIQHYFPIGQFLLIKGVRRETHDDADAAVVPANPTKDEATKLAVLPPTLTVCGQVESTLEGAPIRHAVTTPKHRFSSVQVRDFTSKEDVILDLPVAFSAGLNKKCILDHKMKLYRDSIQFYVVGSAERAAL